MSHFSLIVIGENINDQLEPYAEKYAPEKYLTFQDNEDENLDEYNNKEVDIIVLADGSLHHKNESIFQDNEDDTYPEGSIVRKGRYSEIFDTFEQFMNEYHGVETRDLKTNRYGYWHNANAKYDWYS